MPYAIYILRCSDDSYYTGLTKELDARVQEHQIGAWTDAYTYARRDFENRSVPPLSARKTSIYDHENHPSFIYHPIRRSLR